MHTELSERDARIALAGAARPGDPIANRLITAYGASETVRIARTAKRPPLLTEAQLETWRRQVAPALSPSECAHRARLTEEQALGTLTPDDATWPHTALAALGSVRPLPCGRRAARNLSRRIAVRT